MNGTRRLRLAPARRLAAAVALLGLGLSLLLGGWVAWANLRGEADIDLSAPPPPASAATIERGAYLARAGNCTGCHTAVGGKDLAGGRAVDTPFGSVFAPNITPDAKTGIGLWSAGEFWRALHHGRAKGGRLLYPAFPYPNFTEVTREDADALYVYLRSVPAVERANTPHALRFPYGTQAALAVWRALYFKPGAFAPEPQQGQAWNRGKYLVQGLAHCAACHAHRDALGGTNASDAFAGGVMPDGAWYAPSLASPEEAGIQRWPRQELVKLLRDGVGAQAGASGPMADVVATSTQHLSDEDLDAMAQYLASIPVRSRERPGGEAGDVIGDVMTRGDKVYARHCASCHGDDGQGVAGMYPALAGNRNVNLPRPHNVMQIIRQGGFLPTTRGNPRPFGMPPYGPLLDDQDIAAVATFIRRSWGNRATPLSALDVLRVP